MPRKEIEAPPLAPAIKWPAVDGTVEGIYMGSRPYSKEDNTIVHDFSDAPEGSEYANENGDFCAWGTVDLDRKLKAVEAGTRIYLTYTGDEGRMKIFKVEVDE